MKDGIVIAIADALRYVGDGSLYLAKYRLDCAVAELEELIKQKLPPIPNDREERNSPYVLPDGEMYATANK